MPFTIRIDGQVEVTHKIPALDRLVDYLEAADQPLIDSLASQVDGATNRLKAVTAPLNQAVQTES